jgi:hypothetical protein
VGADGPTVEDQVHYTVPITQGHTAEQHTNEDPEPKAKSAAWAGRAKLFYLVTYHSACYLLRHKEPADEKEKGKQTD